MFLVEESFCDFLIWREDYCFNVLVEWSWGIHFGVLGCLVFIVEEFGVSYIFYARIYEIQEVDVCECQLFFFLGKEYFEGIVTFSYKLNNSQPTAFW